MFSTPSLADLSWVGAIETGSSNNEGSIVTFSNDGTILASSHYDEIFFINAYTNILLPYSIELDYKIESLEFSNDDRYLLAGMESKLSNTPATVVLELIDGKYTRLKHTEDGVHVAALSFDAGNDIFATPNEANGITEWSISNGVGSTASLWGEYPSTHTSNITCLDHTLDGKFLLSGSEDGVVILWNRSDWTEQLRWEENHPVFDCHVSDDGSKLAWLIEGSMHIRNYDEFISYYAQIDIDGHVRQFAFTNQDSEIAMLTPIHDTDASRNIQFMDIYSGDFPILRTLSIAHQASDFSIHHSGDIVAIASSSRLVSLFSTSVPPSTPSNGLDTDYDGVANLFDDDDDGDGIQDEFDLVCSEGSLCDIHADTSRIRQLSFEIAGNDMDIYDTIYLTKEDSTALRDLASQSIYQNAVVDSAESVLISDSVCENVNQTSILEQWSKSIDVDGRNFIANNVECKILSGLSETYRNDDRTRISVRWHVSGKLSAPAIAPYNLTIARDFVNLTGSIGVLVHQSPVHVFIEDISEGSSEIEVWHSANKELTVIIKIPPVEEESTFESISKFIQDYVFVLAPIALLIIAISVIIFVRNRNAIDMEYDDDNFSLTDEDDDLDEIIDEAVGWDDWYEETENIVKDQPKPPEAVIRDIRKPEPPKAVTDDISIMKALDGNLPDSSIDEVTQIHEESRDVGFTHLLDNEHYVASNTNPEDTEIDEALELFKKSVSDPQKRRSVRRKKDPK